MTFLGFIFAQGLSALSQAAILFFIASGLTLIFGIMRIVNFAHGAIFMLGAYVGFTAAALTGSFLLSLLLAPIVVGVVGMAFERIFLRPLYGRRDGGAYLLLTFGLAIVLNELIRVMGFAAAPLGLGILMFIPEVDWGIGLCSIAFFFALTTIAVQSATDAPAGRALAANAAGFLAYEVVGRLLAGPPPPPGGWPPSPSPPPPHTTPSTT